MGKNIILCSDGTGNRWGVGNRTNVSRLYEALDVEKGHNKNRQVRFYDNGVGTSKNRYIKAATGAFGIGLEQNVLDLYEFLARHYDPPKGDDPGDRIFTFGFSRGAATVRAFAGMLLECGLIHIRPREDGTKRYDEDDFQDLLDEARETYRSRLSRGRSTTRKERHERLAKAVKDLGADSYFEHRSDVEIEMVGVWDTVSALGFPQDWSLALKGVFLVLDKASDWVFPHHYYNYDLDNQVKHAYHALAIDDERLTFYPCVWDERESASKSRPQHVEQVWFAGPHSNVGGGYPRTGLSNVTLYWMMSCASHHGLSFTREALEEAKRLSNVHGKLYNSRDGMAIYYRYSPRDLAALCEFAPDAQAKEKSLGSATRKDSSDQIRYPAGTLKIHETARDRALQGTARYAPGLIPRTFLTVETPEPNPNPSDAASLGAPQVRAKRVLDREIWTEGREKVLEFSRKRFRLYRIFVESSAVVLLLALLMWSLDPLSPAQSAGEGKDEIVQQTWLHEILPRTVTDWLQTPRETVFTGWKTALFPFDWLLKKTTEFLAWAAPAALKNAIHLLYNRWQITVVLIVAVVLINRRKNDLRKKYDRAAQELRADLLRARERDASEA